MGRDGLAARLLSAGGLPDKRIACEEGRLQVVEAHPSVDESFA